MQQKKWWQIALLAALLAASAAICAQCLLRNLAPLLSFDPTFSAIFAQIQDAPMTSPVLLGLLLAFGAAILLYRLWQKTKMRVLSVILGVSLWLILFLANTLLTRVNGIRFVDVLISLVDVLQKGGL